MVYIVSFCTCKFSTVSYYLKKEFLRSYCYNFALFNCTLNSDSLIVKNFVY